MKYLRNFVVLLLALLLLSSLAPLPAAHGTQTDAQDLRGSTTISGTGYDSFSFLLDNNLTSYKKSSGNTTIILENANAIGSLYLLLHKQYGSYTITDNSTGNVITAGEMGFLHEYVDIAQAFGYAPTSVTLSFQNGAVQLSEIYVFSQGTPPQHVQRWEPSLDGGADILLLATHGDDDQLFFAGLLPLYAGELDCRVQVVYLTDHRSGFVDNARMHEMLNGLWAVGVEAYPVFGSFADFRIDDLKGTYDYYKNSYSTSKDDLLSFVVEQIRRFRPQVIVGHDINGEYGHGMHMVYTDLLIQALDITSDPTVFPASAETYGTWDVPKAYLHLYEENQIVLDYDQPLDYFDGLTAFQATQKLGYPCHKSQQYTWFTRWINGNNNEITKASQITTYNPAYFGLYRSTVGADVLKDDFLENITTYAQQEQAKLDQEAADGVSALIGALGQITLESGDAISNARNAYDSLTDTQKVLVTNLDTLTEAEACFTQLTEEKIAEDAANQAAAEAVIALIDEIPDTLTDDSPIISARQAYDALTETQKELVTNLADLLDAEADYAEYLRQVEELLKEEQERLELEQLAAQQQELKDLMILLLVLFILLLFSLLLLRHKRKHQKRRRRRR